MSRGEISGQRHEFVGVAVKYHNVSVSEDTVDRFELKIYQKYYNTISRMQGANLCYPAILF